MQTHRDDQHINEFMDRLRLRAAGMVKDKASEITAGKEGEKPLAEWQSNGVGVRHLPPDEQNILRISIGGGNTPANINYCVFRGDHGACVDLLRKALAAMEDTR